MSSDLKLSINITADARQGIEAFGRLKSSLAETEARLQTARERAADLARQLKQPITNNAIEAQAGKIAATEQALVQARRELAYFFNQARNAGPQGWKVFGADIASTERAIKRMTASLGEQQAAMTRLQESARDKLAREFDQATTSARRLKDEVSGQQVALEKARRSLSAQGVDVTRLAEEYRRLGKEAADAAQRAETAKAKMQADRASIRAALASANYRDSGLERAREVLSIRPHAEIAAEINRVKSAYETLRASGALSGAELAQASHRYREALRGLAEQMNGTVTVQDRLSNAMSVASRAFALLQGAMVAGGVVKVADDMALLAARVRLVSASQDQAKTAMAGIFEIAARAQAPVDAVGQSYTRFAGAIRALGGTQQESLRFTEAVALGLRVSGASAVEAGAAMMQLAQAMQAGRLNGDEFRSVNENGGKLLDYLAAQLGKSRGELALMAEQGQLTSDLLRQALPAALEQIRADAEQLPPTVGGAMTALSNAFKGWVHESQAVAVTTRGMALTVQFLAQHMDGLMNLGIAAGVVAIAGAFLKLRTALLAARAAGIAFSLANPWLLGVAALGTAVGFFASVGAAAEDAGEQQSQAAEDAKQKYDELNDRLVNLAQRKGQLERRMADAAKDARKAELEAAKKSVNEQIHDYERLKDSLLKAYEAAGQAAEQARQKADGLRQSASDRRKSTVQKLEDRQIARTEKDDPAAADQMRAEAAAAALSRAQALQANAIQAAYQGNTEAVAQYSQALDALLGRVENLGGAMQDQAVGDDLIAQAGELAARNLETQARAEEELAKKEDARAQALNEQMRANQARVDELKANLTALEGQIKSLAEQDKTIALQADQAALEKVKTDIESVRAQLASLPDTKTITIQTVQSGSAATASGAVDGAVEGKAAGGPITGPGPVGVDSRLILAAPGEHMLTAQEVAAAGGHAGIYRIRAALRAGRLGSFALGGAIGDMLPTPPPVRALAQAPAVRTAAPRFPHLGRVDFSLGGRDYPVYARPEVAGDLRDHLAIERLKRGGRR